MAFRDALFDLFRKDPGGNRRMLAQFRSNLSIRLSTVEEDVKTTPSGRAQVARATELLERPVTGRPGGFDWNDAYEVEKLLVHLCPAETLARQVSRQLEQLKRIAPDFGTFYEGELKALEERHAEAVAGRAGADPARYHAELRVLLERLFDDIHWRSTQRVLNRNSVGRFTRLVMIASVVCSLVFGLLLYVTFAWDRASIAYTGLPLALTAGLVGASFSIMTGKLPPSAPMSLEEMWRRTGVPFLLLRLGIGGVAAMILYFFFEAGMLAGDLVPNLRELGYASTGATDEAVAALNLAFERASAAGVDKVRALFDDPEAREFLLTNTFAQLQDDSREASRVLLGGAAGALVPNAELCKLLVWSFAAGFSEKLVASILGTVQERSEVGSRS